MFDCFSDYTGRCKRSWVDFLPKVGAVFSNPVSYFWLLPRCLYLFTESLLHSSEPTHFQATVGSCCPVNLPSADLWSCINKAVFWQIAACLKQQHTWPWIFLFTSKDRVFYISFQPALPLPSNKASQCSENVCIEMRILHDPSGGISGI